jgi:hypothetical protein
MRKNPFTREKTGTSAVRDHLILAKVRLADLVDADERHPRWQANFNRVCSKHIDFVICDSLFRPIIAVELDGSSHEREDQCKRDLDVDRILENASLPLLRVFARKAYDPELISCLLLGNLRSRQSLRDRCGRAGL